MVHKESQETFDFIADWIAPDFFYSKKDVWHRFGMLGVFGDFVLSCTPGDVLEIGVGESSIYLGHVARKYNRKIYHCDISPAKITNPLTVNGYIWPKAAIVPDKVYWGQQDSSEVIMDSSDAMFKNVKPQNLALSFIDGDHNYDQVARDFFNVLDRTVDNGYILLHDTYPPSEEYTNENRCGTVYRLRQQIEQDPRCDCITLPVGCAISVGLTIVRKKPAHRPEYQQ